MPAIACVKCSRFLRVKKNGVYVEEGMPVYEGGWQPYKLWEADLFECPGCGFQLVSGFARQPIAEHYMDRYQQLRDRFTPMIVVNDCSGVRP